MWLPLVGVAAVDHDIDAIEAALEEALVGLDLQLIRHDPGGVGQHAVFGNDGVAFDAARMGHGCLSQYRA
jgi:hypothetical protein